MNRYRLVLEFDYRWELKEEEVHTLFIARYPMTVLALIPEIPESAIKGCRRCEYFLNTFDQGNKAMRPCCNHPRNIQPKQRNFQRQKPLSMGYFANPPAWCKKVDDNG